jgi:hypothetical protein
VIVLILVTDLLEFHNDKPRPRGGAYNSDEDPGGADAA